MIGRLNHVAIAVPDLEKAVSQYRDMLGAKVSAAEDQPDHGVTTVFIELPNTKIELLHPLGDSSPIQAFSTRTGKAASITSAMRSMTSSRRGIGWSEKGRGCWVTATQDRRTRQACPLPFTQRIFAAPSWSWSRPRQIPAMINVDLNFQHRDLKDFSGPDLGQPDQDRLFLVHIPRTSPSISLGNLAICRPSRSRRDVE